jgi:hypothetical protein
MHTMKMIVAVLILIPVAALAGQKYPTDGMRIKLPPFEIAYRVCMNQQKADGTFSTGFESCAAITARHAAILAKLRANWVDPTIAINKASRAAKAAPKPDDSVTVKAAAQNMPPE